MRLIDPRSHVSRRGLITGGAALAAYAALPSGIGHNGGLSLDAEADNSRLLAHHPKPPAAGATTTWDSSKMTSGQGCNLTNGSLTFNTASGTANMVLSTNSHASGKYVFEVTDNASTVNAGCGIAIAAQNVNNSEYVGNSVNSWGWNKGDSHIYNNSGTLGGITATWPTLGTAMMLAFDFTAHLMWVLDASGNWNGAAIGSQNPATGTGGVSFTAGTYFACSYLNSSSAATSTINCGQTAFTNTTPSGFSAWG